MLFLDAHELLLFQPAKNGVLSLRIGIGSLNKLLRSSVVFVGVEINEAVSKVMTNFAVIMIWRCSVGILNIIGHFSCNLLIFALNEGPMVMLKKDLTASVTHKLPIPAIG